MKKIEDIEGKWDDLMWEKNEDGVGGEDEGKKGKKGWWRRGE